MKTLKKTKAWMAGALFAALLFAGCGSGGGESDSNEVYSFSVTDSNTTDLSDAGTVEQYYYQQWYLQCDQDFCSEYLIDPEAGIDLAYDEQVNNGGEGVTVAVIDDSLDMYHPDLEGALVASYSIYDRSSDVNPANPSETHGTQVTGIVSARINGKGIAGIAPKSRLVFLKMSLYMSDSETVELFYKAAELGADVINCSWGSYDVSDVVRDAIVDLATNGRDGKGIIIVFAAGNDAIDMGNDEANIPEVISVGASDEKNDRTNYSNYGDNLDILAPGGEYMGITTLDISGYGGDAVEDLDYMLATDPNHFTGTSAAAPVTTGVIALMLAKNPNLTRDEVESLLRSTADKIGSMEYVDGFNPYYGYGKLNAARVLEAVQ